MDHVSHPQLCQLHFVDLHGCIHYASRQHEFNELWETYISKKKKKKLKLIFFNNLCIRRNLLVAQIITNLIW